MITSELLESYLACPTKCYLHSTEVKGSENDYSTWYRQTNDSFRRAVSSRSSQTGSRVAAGVARNFEGAN